MAKSTTRGRRQKKSQGDQDGNTRSPAELAEMAAQSANDNGDRPDKKDSSAKQAQTPKDNPAKGSHSPRPVIDQETHAKYESIKRGELHITDLQKMTVSELH